MVKSLRNKFMIVTISLMLVLFGGFLIINTIYTNYWNRIEISDMLEWISYSGIFANYQGNHTDEQWILDITNEDNSIAGLVVNKYGEVLDVNVIGKDKKIEIDNAIIQEMCKYKSSRIKIKNYYYSYSELNDGNQLLIVMKQYHNKRENIKVIGIIILIICGISLLIFITFLLSRFITTPAQNMLLREKRFISDASHELKTPLGAICINAQALEMEYQNNLHVRNIISESKRMSRLIERLLVLSKYDEQQNLESKKICLSSLCEEMALTFESVAFEKGINFKYEIENNIYMDGDEDQIRQLLANLIDNAIKNTNSSGNITLSCFLSKRQKCISISNTGKGIPEEDIPHVFERFYTSDVSRESGSFGLGLAIAKTIAEKHKGTIRVESIPNDITEFQVVF